MTRQPDDEEDRREAFMERMDFVIVDPEFDDDTHSVRFSWAPDPARYQRREIEGQWGWWDPLEFTFFPDYVLKSMMEQLPGTPMYLQRPLVEDALEYARSRLEPFGQALDAGRVAGAPTDKSGDFLEGLGSTRHGFAVLVVDLVGSTMLSQSLSVEENARVISVVVSEAANLVPLFHGHVLKYTGDGLIAYFPEPSFLRMNDMAIDCAMSMTVLFDLAINPALRVRDLPELNMRAGLESGEAMVVMMGTEASKFQADLIGRIINIAAKIQALGQPGSVLVGESMDRSLHTAWRLQLRDFETPPTWAYRSSSGRPYRVLSVGRLEEDGPRIAGSPED